MDKKKLKKKEFDKLMQSGYILDKGASYNRQSHLERCEKFFFQFQEVFGDSWDTAYISELFNLVFDEPSIPNERLIRIMNEGLDVSEKTFQRAIRIKLSNVFLKDMMNPHTGRYYIKLAIESWDDFSEMLQYLGKTVSIEVILKGIIE